MTCRHEKSKLNIAGATLQQLHDDGSLLDATPAAELHCQIFQQLKKKFLSECINHVQAITTDDHGTSILLEPDL